MATSPSFDGGTAFELLSNERRRRAVRACDRLECPFELGELAEHVAARECGKPITQVTGAERRRVYTSLQQVHIDKLEDAGVIECERKTITPTEKLKELRLYLNGIPTDESSWSRHYLKLSLLTGLISVFIWTGMHPEAIQPAVWLSLVVIAFGISASVHYLQTNQHKLNYTGIMSHDE